MISVGNPYYHIYDIGVNIARLQLASVSVGALMEKPLDLPLLLQTIEDLLVEPLEKRLARLIGKRPITRYLQADI